PFARGVFFGISLAHESRHAARAVLEGITFALRDSYELVRMLGIRPVVARVTGGGAASSFWLQMIADVLGIPVLRELSDVGPAFGAALLAGAGAGLFESASAAAKQFNSSAAPLEPNPQSHERYQSCYALY